MTKGIKRRGRTEKKKETLTPEQRETGSRALFNKQEEEQRRGERKRKTPHREANRQACRRLKMSFIGQRKKQAGQREKSKSCYKIKKGES